MAPTVALVCREARLRTVLRLALEADGYAVEPCEQLTLGTASAPSAIVVDLDSLRLDAPSAVAALRAGGVPDATPLLLVSVYPPASGDLARAGPTDYLQPPFAPQEFARRLRRTGQRVEGN